MNKEHLLFGSCLLIFILHQVLEKRDAPADQNHHDQRRGFEFEVAVPRDGHEDIRCEQQPDRQNRNRQS